MTEKEQVDATLLIVGIQEELQLGTTHFHPETNAPLTTVREILETLAKSGKVTIEPIPERRDEFRRMWGATNETNETAGNKTPDH